MEGAIAGRGLAVPAPAPLCEPGEAQPHGQHVGQLGPSQPLLAGFTGQPSSRREPGCRSCAAAGGTARPVPLPVCQDAPWALEPSSPSSQPRLCQDTAQDWEAPLREVMSSCPLLSSRLQEQCFPTRGFVGSSVRCFAVSAQAVEALLVMAGLGQDGATVLCVSLAVSAVCLAVCICRVKRRGCRKMHLFPPSDWICPLQDLQRSVWGGRGRTDAEALFT